MLHKFCCNILFAYRQLNKEVYAKLESLFFDSNFLVFSETLLRSQLFNFLMTKTLKNCIPQFVSQQF